MEQPGFRSYNRDLTVPSESSRTPYSSLPEVSRLAGHFLTERYDKHRRRFTRNAAEAVVNSVIKPDQQPEAQQNLQYSAWHRIETDDSGHAKTLQEQDYGRAMQLEVSAEQGSLGHLASSQAPDQQTVQGATAVAVLSAARQQSSLNSATRQDQTSQAGHQGRTTLPYRGMSRPQMPPRNLQRSLSPGHLTQDPEHMLEARPPSLPSRILKSPWTWLAVGIAMVIYFI